MDIKYNVVKLKNGSTEEIKDSISVEEPLEMRLRFKKNDKWETQNISITCLLYTSPSPRDRG